MTSTWERRGNAVVIGGSLAGLLAARVLADYFEQVIVVERGAFSLAGDAHSDVPQASHTHVLLLRGRQIMERLLPGLEAEVLAHGAPLSDSGLDSLNYGRYGWAPRWATGLTTFAASRHLLDVVIRRRVLAMSNVEARGGCEVTGLLAHAQTVQGVRLRRRTPDAIEEQLHADFVVDAGGRSSCMPKWLEELGYPRPRETVIDAHVGYATRWYRNPPNVDLGWKTLTIQSLAPEVPRGGVVVEMENNQLAVTLLGAAGDYPPTEATAFLSFAQSLRSPMIYDVIKDLEPISPVYGYRRTENRLVHYDRMPRFPEHLAILGDAACGFNPTYGQGMTVAALGAEMLQRTLREQRQQHPDTTLDGVGRRFQLRLVRIVVPAWDLATGEDLRYPTTVGGRRSLIARMIGPYMERLVQTMMVHPDVARTFLEVIHMVKPPAALFHPRMIWLVLRQPRRAIASGSTIPVIDSYAPAVVDMPPSAS